MHRALQGDYDAAVRQSCRANYLDRRVAAPMVDVLSVLTLIYVLVDARMLRVGPPFVGGAERSTVCAAWACAHVGVRDLGAREDVASMLSARNTV